MAQALPAEQRSGWPMVLVTVAALATLGAVVHLTDPGRIPALQNLLLIFGSLLVEAVPFILLGAAVSAAIEVFVPARVFERIARLPQPLQLPAAGLGGMAFPVCECGSVPVARRLVSKGLTPSAAITFMLAAPIINPVVIASTVVAYRGRDALWPMVIGRTGLGMVCAIAVGWVLARNTKADLLRTDGVEEADHRHDESRAAAFTAHLSGDFFFMGKFLVIGALVAALLQTFVPSDVIGAVAETPIVSLLAMMLLAYLLSLCSESDAFVAASFVQFGIGAQLAFLVFGPMVDTKLAFLYRGTYTKGFLTTVVVVVGAITLAGTLWIEVMFG